MKARESGMPEVSSSFAGCLPELIEHPGVFRGYALLDGLPAQGGWQNMKRVGFDLEMPRASACGRLEKSRAEIARC